MIVICTIRNVSIYFVRKKKRKISPSVSRDWCNFLKRLTPRKVSTVNVNCTLLDDNKTCEILKKHVFLFYLLPALRNSFIIYLIFFHKLESILSNFFFLCYLISLMVSLYSIYFFSLLFKYYISFSSVLRCDMRRFCEW